MPPTLDTTPCGAETQIERYYSPAEVARWYPRSRGGRPSHPSKITRHILRGYRLKSGKYERLEAVRFPSGWGVTQAAFDRFVEAITADAIGDRTSPVPIRSPARRQREVAKADRELDALLA